MKHSSSGCVGDEGNAMNPAEVRELTDRIGVYDVGAGVIAAVAQVHATLCVAEALLAIRDELKLGRTPVGAES